MKCEECGHEMEERTSTLDEPYRDTLSGLPNLLLVGIRVRRCRRCQLEVPLIPKVGKLHEAIAQTLLDKPALLTGAELRFLRKHAGIPAHRMAEYLEIDPSHLSRVETGRYAGLSAATDKLARAIVAASAQDEPRHLAPLLLVRRSRRGGRPPIFRLERNRWKAHSAQVVGA